VGDGSHISFWHNWWCGDRSLKQCFPVLYSIVRNKDATVVDNLVVHNGVTQWNVLFTRQIQDWEMEMILSFFERLYSTLVRHGQGDRLVWNPSKRGLFEARSYYEVLIRKNGPSFPWKSIWRVKALTMVAFFVWSTALSKILTHENLRKRNIVVIEWCYMCKKNGESMNHLLLHCEVVCELWSYIFTLFGIEWVMPRTVLELFTSWGASGGYGRAKEAWQLALLCCIWRERNAPLFEDVETSMVELRKRLLNMLYLWIASHHCLNGFSYEEFLNLFSSRPS
jgi:hypothetical protein